MLVEQHGGSLAKLNDLLGLARTDATLSQIRTKAPHSKTGKPRSMGDPLARKIEAKLNLQAGWMDTPPSLAEQYGLEDQRAKTWDLMVQMPESQLQTAYRLISALAQGQSPEEPTPPARRPLLQPSDYVKAHAPKIQKPLKKTGNDAI